jgi:hypothetical protein
MLLVSQPLLARLALQWINLTTFLLLARLGFTSKFCTFWILLSLHSSFFLKTLFEPTYYFKLVNLYLLG